MNAIGHTSEGDDLGAAIAALRDATLSDAFATVNTICSRVEWITSGGWVVDIHSWTEDTRKEILQQLNRLAELIALGDERNMDEIEESLWLRQSLRQYGISV